MRMGALNQIQQNKKKDESSLTTTIMCYVVYRNLKYLFLKKELNI